MKQKHVYLRKKEITDLLNFINEGDLLSNVAYNYKQKSDLPIDARNILSERQQAIDIARTNCRKTLEKLRLFLKAY